MEIIIIPAVISALILFRWARTLALFGLAALVLWIWAHNAHAQKRVMVECQTGHIAQNVPDYACDALTEGYQMLNFSQRRRMNSQDQTGILDCAKVVARHFEGNHPEWFIEPCQRMWTQEQYARAAMR